MEKEKDVPVIAVPEGADPEDCMDFGGGEYDAETPDSAGRVVIRFGE